MNKRSRSWLPLCTFLFICSGTVLNAATKQIEPEGMTNQVVNPPTRQVFGRGWFVTADAMVWIAHEDGLAPVIENNSSTATLDNASNYFNSEIHHLDFKWDWAFRLGAGCDLSHDDWDIYADWVHFYDHAHKHVDADASATTNFACNDLFPTFSGFAVSNTDIDTGLENQLQVTESKAHWKLRLDMIDFELGRSFYTGKWMSIRPFIGLRNAWIRQHMDINYDGGNMAASGNEVGSLILTDFVKMKNHFSGFGPRFGVDTQWNFAKEWSFFGDVALSVLYGRFKIEQEERFGTGNIIVLNNQSFNNRILEVDDHFRASRVITDMILGIRYEHKFSHRDLRLGVSLGWEHHVFYNQNEFKHFPSFSGADTDVNDANVIAVNTLAIPDYGKDLTTQGWTLSLRFDF